MAERGPWPSLHTAPRLQSCTRWASHWNSQVTGMPAGDSHLRSPCWGLSVLSPSPVSLLDPVSQPHSAYFCVPRGHLKPVLCSRPRAVTHTPPAFRSPLWELDLCASLLLALPCASRGDGGLPTGALGRGRPGVSPLAVRLFPASWAPC